MASKKSPTVDIRSATYARMNPPTPAVENPLEFTEEELEAVQVEYTDGDKCPYAPVDLESIWKEAYTNGYQLGYLRGKKA